MTQLTKREQIAAMILQVLSADYSHEQTSAEAVRHADWLLAELAKEQPQPTLKYKAPYPLQYAREGDSGMDVRSNEVKAVTIVSGQTVTISTGVYLEIPQGYEVQVRPKSSISAKGILVHFGTVDEGYRGLVLVTLTNTNTNGYMHTVKLGDKIAQLVLVPIVQAELVEVDLIDANTERGTGGHGSTN